MVKNALVCSRRCADRDVVHHAYGLYRRISPVRAAMNLYVRAMGTRAYMHEYPGFQASVHFWIAASCNSNVKNYVRRRVLDPRDKNFQLFGKENFFNFFFPTTFCDARWAKPRRIITCFRFCDADVF
jgi:hypothetical protein